MAALEVASRTAAVTYALQNVLQNGYHIISVDYCTRRPFVVSKSGGLHTGTPFRPGFHYHNKLTPGHSKLIQPLCPQKHPISWTKLVNRVQFYGLLYFYFQNKVGQQEVWKMEFEASELVHFKVCRHSPVAAGRKCDRTDLRPVRKAGTFELLAYESAHKYA